MLDIVRKLFRIGREDELTVARRALIDEQRNLIDEQKRVIGLMRARVRILSKHLDILLATGKLNLIMIDMLLEAGK